MNQKITTLWDRTWILGRKDHCAVHIHVKIITTMYLRNNHSVCILKEGQLAEGGRGSLLELLFDEDPTQKTQENHMYLYHIGVLYSGRFKGGATGVHPPP